MQRHNPFNRLMHVPRNANNTDRLRLWGFKKMSK